MAKGKDAQESLIIGEMHIKTTMGYTSFIRKAIKKNNRK